MTGGMWIERQNLNGGRVEWPRGPLELDDGEQVIRVEAWIMQQSTGASQKSVQIGHYADDEWVADQDTWNEGDFKPGLAMGVAMVVVSAGDPPKKSSYWWATAIMLV